LKLRPSRAVMFPKCLPKFVTSTALIMKMITKGE
jgi:hypothetical protein